MELYSLLKVNFFLFFLVLISCSDMNDLHDKYLKNGETIYTGRVDSAKLFSGKNRVMVQYWCSDHKAKKLIFYWTFKNDSLLLDIPEKDKKDSVELIIHGLEEGNINFEIFTMNEKSENRSVAYNLSGNVYGDKYLSSLRNRIVRTAMFEPIIGLSIYWSSAVQKSLGDKLEYINNEGETITQLISPNDNRTIIEDLSGDITYQTAYLPTENAIDTFYTDVVKVNFDGSSGRVGVPRLIDAYATQEENLLRFFVFVEGADVENCSFLLYSVGKEVIGTNEVFFKSGDNWYLNGGALQVPNMNILPNNNLNEAIARGVFVHTFDTSDWVEGVYTFEYGWHNRPGMEGDYISFLQKFIFEINNQK